METTIRWLKNDRTSKNTDLLKATGKAESVKWELQEAGNKEIVKGNHYTAVYGDCVEDKTRYMQDNSVDLIHTSIPFGNHYEYSATRSIDIIRTRIGF